MPTCLVLHGSARKGNTYKATMLVAEELSKRPGWELEHIRVHELKLPLCLGCFNCILRDEKLCPHAAIMAPIVQKMQEADALIVGAPIYILHVNAETKNFFDHLAYIFHRPRFFGKKALAITTTAAAGAKTGTRFLRQTLYQIGYNHALELPIPCWNATYQPKAKDLARLSKTAQRFARGVESGRPRKPTWYHILYHSAFRAAALAGSKERSTDHLYWKEQGLIDKVYPTPTGLVKGLGAKAIVAVMRMAMPKE